MAVFRHIEVSGGLKEDDKEGRDMAQKRAGLFFYFFIFDLARRDGKEGRDFLS